MELEEELRKLAALDFGPPSPRMREACRQAVARRQARLDRMACETEAERVEREARELAAGVAFVCDTTFGGE